MTTPDPLSLPYIPSTGAASHTQTEVELRRRLEQEEFAKFQEEQMRAEIRARLQAQIVTPVTDGIGSSAEKTPTNTVISTATPNAVDDICVKQEDQIGRKVEDQPWFFIIMVGLIAHAVAREVLIALMINFDLFLNMWALYISNALVGAITVSAATLVVKRPKTKTVKYFAIGTIVFYMLNGIIEAFSDGTPSIMHGLTLSVGAYAALGNFLEDHGKDSEKVG